MSQKDQYVSVTNDFELPKQANSDQNRKEKFGLKRGDEAAYYNYELTPYQKNPLQMF